MNERPVGCFTILGIVVVVQVAVVLLYRLGDAVGWPIPAGVVVIAGLCMWRRQQRRRQRRGR